MWKSLVAAALIFTAMQGQAVAQHRLTAKQYEDAIKGIEDRIEELQREIAAEIGVTAAEVAAAAAVATYAPVFIGEIPGGVEVLAECIERALHAKAGFDIWRKWQTLQTLQSQGLRDAWGNLLREYPADYRRITSARNHPTLSFYYRQAELKRKGAGSRSCPSQSGPNKGQHGVVQRRCEGFKTQAEEIGGPVGRRQLWCMYEKCLANGGQIPSPDYSQCR